MNTKVAAFIKTTERTIMDVWHSIEDYDQLKCIKFVGSIVQVFLFNDLK
ncbi:MAG: hypothetical protein MUO26_08825 [Methanotrichaceae archaeon]|nr:hypothetical protein [Methanotrichaceae archaeon]